MRRKTKEEFLKGLFEKYPEFKDRYDYSDLEYINSSTKSKILCRECDEYFHITPSGHFLQGSGCIGCSYKKRSVDRRKYSQPELERILYQKYKEKYLFDVRTYINKESKIQVFCKEKDQAKDQYVKALLKGTGCSCCAANKLKTNEKFILDAQTIHKNAYTYDNVSYKNAYTNINITCPFHGDFSQRATHHLSGHGCPDCSLHGFSSSLPARLYLVKWYGFGEEFIKFGITNKTVLQRVRAQSCKSSFNYEILHDFYFKKGQKALDTEKLIKKKFNCGVCKREWLPEGYTETVKINDLPQLLKTINEVIL